MDEYKELLIAIVTQAVEDWRYLCKGGIPTKHCNLSELEEFFKSGCAGYIDHELAKKIYRTLKRERAIAESGPAGVERREKKDRVWYVARKGKVEIGRYSSEHEAWKALKKEAS